MGASRYAHELYLHIRFLGISDRGVRQTQEAGVHELSFADFASAVNACLVVSVATMFSSFEEAIALCVVCLLCCVVLCSFQCCASVRGDRTAGEGKLITTTFWVNLHGGRNECPTLVRNFKSSSLNSSFWLVSCHKRFRMTFTSYDRASSWKLLPKQQHHRSSNLVPST